MQEEYKTSYGDNQLHTRAHAGCNVRKSEWMEQEGGGLSGDTHLVLHLLPLLLVYHFFFVPSHSQTS